MKRFTIATLISLIGVVFALPAQCQDLIIPVSHYFVSLDYSVDGRMIVTGSYEGTIKVWGATERKLFKTVKADGCSLVKFSSDGRLFLGWDENANTSFLTAWDVQSGKQVFQVPVDGVYSHGSNFSPNGTVFATGDGSAYQSKSEMQLIELSTGKRLRLIEHNEKLGNIYYSGFTRDGKELLGRGSHDQAILWNVETGRIERVFGDKREESSCSWALFSNDERRVITSSSSKKVTVYDLNSGREENSFRVSSDRPVSMACSPDGRTLLFGYDSVTDVYDLERGKMKFSLRGSMIGIRKVFFSPDGQSIVVSSNTFTKIWNTSGTLIAKLKSSVSGLTPDKSALLFSEGTAYDIKTGALISSQWLQATKPTADPVFSSDGERVILSLRKSIYSFTTGALQDSTGGFFDFIDNDRVLAIKRDTLEIRRVGLREPLRRYTGKFLSLSPDKKRMVIRTGESAVCKEIDSDRTISVLPLKNATYRFKELSSTGTYLALGASENLKKLQIWDLDKGQLIQTFETESNLQDIHFSPDDRYLVTTESSGGYAILWDVATGTSTLLDHFPEVNKAKRSYNRLFNPQFSPDGHLLATASSTDIFLWSYPQGRLQQKFTTTGTLKGYISTFRFSPDGKFLAISDYGNLTSFWDIGHQKLAYTYEGSLAAFVPSHNIVITKLSGALRLWNLETGKELFSLVSMPNSEFVVYNSAHLFDATPTAMEKLYFVQGTETIDLSQLKDRYYEPGLWRKAFQGESMRDASAFSAIELPPSVSLKEVDANGYLAIDLANRGGGIGEVNVLLNGKEIITDARGDKPNPNSPALSLKVYIADNKNLMKGSSNIIAVKAWNTGHWVVSKGNLLTYDVSGSDTYRPAVYILTCGISDYAGTEIDLKYAAKDASDVTLALKVGATKLFGSDKSFVFSLNSANPESPPTKANIVKTFKQIAVSANPRDVVIVYLSGHGINLGGSDGDWHYLTQESSSANAAAYTDPAVSRGTTLSSTELVDLFKSIPAAKQVLIIDACASGKVVENLIAKRDIASSSLRALDRMKDRTGMHIITGCTADAVSYEASQFGQGVLTYSLLEGIRGAALRDEQFIDVNKLFQYAQERVPVLATGLGGIQTPVVFSPNGSQSFDVGELGDTEKKSIPIAVVKPVYVRSTFQDENELEDVLGMGKEINASLNELSAKGSIVFVDVGEYPGGCKLIGRYRKENGRIILKLRKRCSGKDSIVDISAADLPELTVQVVNSLGK
jgi:WD40 repeat protein